MSHDPYRAVPDVLAPEPLAGRRPRLLAHVHIYPPTHNAGAEWFLHTTLLAMREAGWDVAVWASMAREGYTFQGIEVHRADGDALLAEPYTWCDVALTHLDCTHRATAWAMRAHRPLVHLVHNHRQLQLHQVKPRHASLVVWNSRWSATHDGYHRTWPGDSLLVHPPVRTEDYRTRRTPSADAITMLNTNEAKGSALFYDLARAMPERKFLAVAGAYGHQVPPPPDVRNVEWWPNTPDVRKVYTRTRVLLVPSAYESWGRVAAEAMASGIPVVHSGTPGLLECTTSPGGVARAMSAHPDHRSEWEAHLRTLDVPRAYDLWAASARVRSAELDAQAVDELDALDVALRKLLP